MNNRFLTFAALLSLAVAGATARAQQPPEQQPAAQQPTTEQATASAPNNASAAPAAPVRVMRDFRGVKLGMKPAEVRAAMGKPELSEKEKDRFVIKGDDRLTVYYENGAVRAIQLYILDPKNAPAWADVVGDAEVMQMENGAQHARRAVSEEGFWVSMYRSKDGAITTVTISR